MQGNGPVQLDTFTNLQGSQTSLTAKTTGEKLDTFTNLQGSQTDSQFSLLMLALDTFTNLQGSQTVYVNASDRL